MRKYTTWKYENMKRSDTFGVNNIGYVGGISPIVERNRSEYFMGIDI